MKKEDIDKLNKLSTMKYYDKQGKIIGLGDWSNLFDDINYKRVAIYKNLFIRVSTIWLGIDHSFGGKIPLIFETMVFPIWKYRDIECSRYPTLKLAKRGHDKLVKKYKYRIDLAIGALLNEIAREIKYKYWSVEEKTIKLFKTLKRRFGWKRQLKRK